MKKNYLFAMLCLISVSAFAQGSLGEGKFQLNAGVGISGWGTPLYVGFDYGASKDISVGAELSFRSDSETYAGNKYKSSAIGIGVNGNYHFNYILEMPKKWDLYAGLGLTYYSWTYDNNDYRRNNASNFGLGAQVGARYFFTNAFGINLELGGGNAVSGAQFGITYKF